MRQSGAGPPCRSRLDVEKSTRIAQGTCAKRARRTNDIRWAQYIVLFFPHCLSDVPALPAGSPEQIAISGFAFVCLDGSTSMLKRIAWPGATRLHDQ